MYKYVLNNKKLLLSGVFLLLFLIVSAGSVSATEVDNDSLIIEDDNISDTYGCGAAAFKIVLEDKRINITLDEAAKATNTVNGSTSMQDLIDGAEKYNLSAVGVNIQSEDLKTDYIVHMNIDNTEHWAVIEDVSEQTFSNNLTGEEVLPLDEFKQYYTNRSVIISNDSNFNIENFSSTLLSSQECKEIQGNKWPKLPKLPKIKIKIKTKFEIEIG